MGLHQQPHAQSVCNLLCLPAELRTPIYILLLTLPTSAPQSRALLPPLDSLNLDPPQPTHRTAILTASRLINREATHLLYYLNTFLAHSTLLTSLPSHVLNPSIPILSHAYTKMIKKWHIHVRLDIDARFTEAQVTDAFSGAEELVVECSEAMFRSSGCGVLMSFRGIRGVKDAMVKGNVEDGVKEWLEKRMRRPIGWMDGGDDEIAGWDALRVLDASGRQRYEIWKDGGR